jgi:hypothetical protein
MMELAGIDNAALLLIYPPAYPQLAGLFTSKCVQQVAHFAAAKQLLDCARTIYQVAIACLSGEFDFSVGKL